MKQVYLSHIVIVGTWFPHV